MSLEDFDTILKDKSFGDDAFDKIDHYAKSNSNLVKDHPMTLIYCCIKSDDVGQCMKLVSLLSRYTNHIVQKPSTDNIVGLIDTIMNSKKNNLETIFECEEKFLDTIVSVPALFFKACNDRSRFNKEQLLMMLSMKEKVDSRQMSQHDASVDIGTNLVDKYVKKHINK
tara:strand:- start:9446 stop:9949 length:504 start_codon:yes stop_codon:yes gene_type:complete